MALPNPIVSPAAMDGSNMVVRAHLTHLHLLFTGWISHFKDLSYIKETTMELLDRTVCKKTVELTVKEKRVRQAIGLDLRFWKDLVNLFRVANPSLEQRSYSPGDPLNHGYDGPNSNAIVQNSITLLRDLQRLDSMLTIARNVLTEGEKVQNLAAQTGFDREVCAVINLCIKITARGYDGDGTSMDEDKWQGVINGFKKLLITSLQFLSNFVTMNERLKLMLWVELFDTSAESLNSAPVADPNIVSPDVSVDKWVRSAIDGFKQQQSQALDPSTMPDNERPTLKLLREMNTPFLVFAVEKREEVKTLIADGGQPTEEAVSKELTKRWREMPDSDRQHWQAISEERHAEIEKMAHLPGAELERLAKEALIKKNPKSSMPNTTATPNPDDLNAVFDNTAPAKVAGIPSQPPNTANVLSVDEAPRWAPPVSKTGMMESAADGARKLREGKTQLLQRLENAPAERAQNSVRAGPPALPSPPPSSPQNGEEQPLALEDEEEDDEQDVEESEEEESSEDDYALPGEDGRGLLTDVPLILGPNEIEVLPMIIMSGIVAPSDGVNAKQPSQDAPASSIINMYTIRCHLLLAQENGRNLLRELLIFVAAWDLREEELYFKFMVKIMEAILVNGLMPFAYGAFKETKDIISPAQAVIMKLLTKIFHSRHGFINSLPTLKSGTQSSDESVQSSAPVRYDIQIVHYLFSEFRQNIIPQICALIFLQGQIRMGHAHLEDFPLNLWDMERMYEGVYQYLEFFAILTDHDAWKQLMAEWEVTSELLTLLGELDIAIPKGRLVPPQPPPPPQRPEHPGAMSQPPTPPSKATPSPCSSARTTKVGPVPVAVERPYDVDAAGAESGRNTAQISGSNQGAPGSAGQTPIEPGTGSGAAAEPSLDSAQPVPPQPYPEPLHDEPADFEWRNLKKLCILVLSSLVWKNSKLQDQVRRFGGITTILACCAHDDHNPYIREHAIMCLRFLLEGNAANQNVVRGLADGYVEVPEDEVGLANLDFRRPGTVGMGEYAKQSGNGKGPMVKVKTDLPVPGEVLDQQGYETFVDSKGQVGLRRKETPVRPPSSPGAGEGSSGTAIANGGKKTGLLDPEHGGSLPDLMQMVMRNVPR